MLKLVVSFGYLAVFNKKYAKVYAVIVFTYLFKREWTYSRIN